MTKNLKIGLWIGGSAAALGLIYVVVIPTFKKDAIRKRLQDAFDNPNSASALGGIEGLQADGTFDPNRYKTSGKATITRIQAIDRANKIWSAYGGYLMADDEAKMVDAFEGLGHYDDLSKIGYYFETEVASGENLFSVLQHALEGDKKQTRILLGKVADLPRD